MSELCRVPHALRTGLVRHVRQRRVMQEDAHLAVVVALVAEGVLDLGDAVVGGGVEVVLAHGLGGGAGAEQLATVRHLGQFRVGIPRIPWPPGRFVQGLL